MAQEIVQNVRLAFQGDTTRMQAELKQLRAELSSLSTNANILDPYGNLVEGGQQAIQTVAKLQGALRESTTKTGNLKLDTLASEFKTMGLSVEGVVSDLNMLGPAGQKAAAQLVNQITGSMEPVNALRGAIGKLGTELASAMKWQLRNTVARSLLTTLSSAFGYAKSLNGSLNDIRIITGESAENMADFAKQANKSAQALGASTLSYTKASLIYYQQGLNAEEVAARTDATLKLANVTGQSASEISSYMTAIWNNFAEGAENLEYYEDVITKLGATTAASSSEIAEGLQQFSAIANTVGLSYEYASSALATIVAQTRQSASTVGNGLRTIFSRLESLKLGEDLEDGVDYTKYTQALAEVGVQAVDANGNLRQMDDILDDLGARWESLGQAERVALAQTVGGVRQYTNLIALMDNYDKFRANVNVARDSEGTVDEQNAIYLESWAAAAQKLKTAWQGIYDTLIDDKFFINLTNFAANIVTFINDMARGLGGLKTLLPAIGAGIMSIFGDKIVSNGKAIVGEVTRYLTFNKPGGGLEQAESMREAAYNIRFNRESNTGNTRVNDLFESQNQSLKEFIANSKNYSHSVKESIAAMLERNKVIQDYVQLQGDAAQKEKESTNSILKEDYGASSENIEKFNIAIEERGTFDYINNLYGKYRDDKNGFDSQAFLSGITNNEMLASTPFGQDIISQLEEAVRTSNPENVVDAIGEVLATIETQAKEKVDETVDNIINESDNGKKLQDLETKLKSVQEQKQQMKDGVGGPLAEDDVLWDDYETLNKQEQALREQVEQTTKAIETDKKELEDRAKTGAKSTEELVHSVQLFNGAGDVNTRAAEEQARLDKYNASFVGNISNMSQALMGYNTLLSVTSSAMKTWSDSSASVTEKIGALVGILPMLTFGLSRVSKGVQAMIEQNFLHAASVVSVATAEEVKTAAETGQLALHGLLVKSEEKLILTQMGLNAAILGSVAVVFGLIWIFKQLAKQLKENSKEYKLQKLTEETKEAEKAAEQASKAYEELQNQLDKLSSDPVKDLTEGTLAYTKAIIEQNSEIDKLLEKYGLLGEAGIYDVLDNGAKVLTEEGARRIEQEEYNVYASNTAFAAYKRAELNRAKTGETAEEIYLGLLEKKKVDSLITIEGNKVSLIGSDVAASYDYEGNTDTKRLVKSSDAQNDYLVNGYSDVSEQVITGVAQAVMDNYSKITKDENGVIDFNSITDEMLAGLARKLNTNVDEIQGALATNSDLRDAILEVLGVKAQDSSFNYNNNSEIVRTLFAGSDLKDKYNLDKIISDEDVANAVVQQVLSNNFENDEDMLDAYKKAISENDELNQYTNLHISGNKILGSKDDKDNLEVDELENAQTLAKFQVAAEDEDNLSNAIAQTVQGTLHEIEDEIASQGITNANQLDEAGKEGAAAFINGLANQTGLTPQQVIDGLQKSNNNVIDELQGVKAGSQAAQSQVQQWAEQNGETQQQYLQNLQEQAQNIDNIQQLQTAGSAELQDFVKNVSDQTGLTEENVLTQLKQQGSNIFTQLEEGSQQAQDYIAHEAQQAGVEVQDYLDGIQDELEENNIKTAQELEEKGSDEVKNLVNTLAKTSGLTEQQILSELQSDYSEDLLDELAGYVYNIDKKIEPTTNKTESQKIFEEAGYTSDYYAQEADRIKNNDVFYDSNGDNVADQTYAQAQAAIASQTGITLDEKGNPVKDSDAMALVAYNRLMQDLNETLDEYTETTIGAEAETVRASKGLQDLNETFAKSGNKNLVKNLNSASHSLEELTLNERNLVYETASGLNKAFGTTAFTAEYVAENFDDIYNAAVNGGDAVDALTNHIREYNKAQLDAIDVSEEFKNANGGNVEGIVTDYDAAAGNEKAQKLIEDANKFKDNFVYNMGDAYESIMSTIDNADFDIEGTVSYDTSPALQQIEQLNFATAEQAEQMKEKIGESYDVDAEVVAETVSLPVLKEVWEGTGNEDTEGQAKHYEMETFTTYHLRVNNASKRDNSKIVGGGNDINKSSGGGGSKKDPKKYEDEVKRYEVVDNKLEQVNKTLEKISKTEDRAFGTSKIRKMDEELTELNKQLDLQNEKLEEAQGYLSQDAAKLAGYGAQFDENGVVSNYEALVKAQVDAYNANLGNEDAEKRYEEFTKAYDDYKESLNTVRDIEADIMDTRNEIYDKTLEKITYTVEFKTELEDNSVELLDYLLERVKDDAYEAGQQIAIMGQKVASAMSIIETNSNALNEMMVTLGLTQQQVNDYLKGDLNIEDIKSLLESTYDESYNYGEVVKNIESYTKELLSQNKELYDNWKEIYETISAAGEKFKDDISSQTDKINKAASSVEHFINIIDAVGANNLGINNSLLSSLRKNSIDGARATMATARIVKDQADKSLNALNEELQRRLSDPEASAEGIKQLQEQIKKAQEEALDANEEFEAAFEETINSISEYFKSEIEMICDTFDKAVSGMANSLAYLQELYDQQSTLDDEYLDDYERLYNLNKLNAQITKSIDDTSNIRAKEILLQLQNEINEKEAEGVELSQYDLDTYQKRYELYLAMIALQEAQNAKNTVRMTKDSEGNWGYVYTASREDIDKAEQDYRDKLYEYAKANDDYIKETESAVIKLQQEFKDAMSELDINDEMYESKLANLQDFYMKQITYQVNQLQNAMIANEEVNAQAAAMGWNMVETFSNTILSQVSGYTSLTEMITTIQNSIQNAVVDANNTVMDYKDNVDSAIKEYGANNFGEAASDALQNSNNLMQEAIDMAEQFGTQYRDNFEEALSSIRNFADENEKQMQKVIDKNVETVKSYNDIIEALAYLGDTGSGFANGAGNRNNISNLVQGVKAYNNSFDTGGYTGNWSGDGRLAILHQKELVLNANDTSNILQSVSFVRQLGDAVINAAKNFSAMGLAALVPSTIGSVGDFEQQVSISASFPNAVRHDEIEQAFNDLINQATQYANRKI